MRISPKDALRRFAGLALAAGLALGATGAIAADAAVTHPASHATAGAAIDKVVVLTSYPEELTVRFQAAFERQYPGKRVEILWRQSADAMAYLKRSRGEVDVYWTPAPGNFAALREEGRFARLKLDHKALPGNIGGSPISDPEGYFAAFELAGHGIAYNKDTVHRLGLPAPRDWPDLAHPAYAGLIQVPIPGRIGFAPVLIETVLQGYGWERGWALLSEIAGNADFGGSGDNTPAADEVASGRKAARMTIDFFAATAIANGAPMGFAYPRKTAYNPAQVAVFADAPHPANARAFVDFVLSAQGQGLLLHPDVRRLPVRKALYDAHPELPAQPFAAGNLGYDGKLARARQGLVAALFESALVHRHAELAGLWAEVHRAEAAGLKQHPAIRAARALLSAPPIPDATQADADLRLSFAFPERTPGATREEAAAPVSNPLRDHIEVYWAAELDARITAARNALQTVGKKG